MSISNPIKLYARPSLDVMNIHEMKTAVKIIEWNPLCLIDQEVGHILYCTSLLLFCQD